MSRILNYCSATLFLLAACAGEDGTSYLTDLSPEAPGANCASGGTAISTGPDSNDNGTLDDSEVAQTEYVCNSASLTNVTPEAAGTNCAAGGVKIETGPDTNQNGTLDAGEATATNYVCGSGDAKIVKVFDNNAAGQVANTGLPFNLLTASITTTTGGDLLAIASTDVYCTTAQCPANGNPPASGYFWISTGTNDNAPVAEYDYWFMQPNETETLTRTSHFPITAAGTHMFNLRGQDDAGAFTFYRPGLTLVFIP